MVGAPALQFYNPSSSLLCAANLAYFCGGSACGVSMPHVYMMQVRWIAHRFVCSLALA